MFGKKKELKLINNVKTCPFCGSNKITEKASVCGCFYHKIECTNCHAQITTEAYAPTTAKEKAYELWNMRSNK